MHDLTDLLEQCSAQPRAVQSLDGGAHLALLLHCAQRYLCCSERVLLARVAFRRHSEQLGLNKTDL